MNDNTTTDQQSQEHLFRPLVWVHDDGNVSVDFCQSYESSYCPATSLCSDDPGFQEDDDLVDAACAVIDSLLPDRNAPGYKHGEMSGPVASAFLRALADHIDAHHTQS